MRKFILFSRRGRTDSDFKCLREGGRLDVVYQCLLFGLFTSGAIRRNVIFQVILGGPPRPPLCVTIDGRFLHDVRTDEETWEAIIKKILSGGSHKGISVSNRSLQDLIKKQRCGNLYVFEEKGEEIQKVEFGKNPVFILGDQVGLPKKDERYILRFGKKISLGKKAYLAASCVDIVNYVADLQNVF